MNRRVTTSDARRLERARFLLERGRISFGRWVEVLDAWVRGEDVEAFDFGDAESIPERILVQCRGVVTPAYVAETLGVDRHTAAQNLSRMARRGEARRLRQGEYLVGRERGQSERGQGR